MIFTAIFNHLNRRIGDCHTWATFLAFERSPICQHGYSNTNFLNSSPEQTTEQHTRQVFTYLTSVDIRLLESDISHCTLSTHVPRGPYVCTRQSSTFLHWSSWSSWIFLQRSALVIGALALDRHCSATMFGVFLHCVLCCLISWATPLIGPQCTVGVLAGTHWGAHRYPDRLVSGTKRQLSGCCC